MIVLKFGGTSVQDTEAVARAVRVIRRQLSRGEVVVLSAMGKTTNGLLEMAGTASSGDIESAWAIRDELRDLHLTVARELVSGRRWQKLETSLSALFQEMTDIVQGLYLLGEASPRSTDRVASFGERMSTLIFSEVLQANGIPAELVDSRDLIRTDDHFTKAAVLQELTRNCVREQLPPRLQEGKVVVAPGFVGSTVDGVTTTIGRGGSDYTAALIGAALDAEDIQIWTDVPGVLTADPRIVPEVYKIRAISFAEAAELAYFGAKVLHPSTLMHLRSDRDIPGACLQFQADRRAGNLHFRRSRFLLQSHQVDCLQTGDHHRQHPVHPDAALLWFPPPDLRGVRDPRDGGRRGGHLRGQRLPDGRFLSGVGGDLQ